MALEGQDKSACWWPPGPGPSRCPRTVWAMLEAHSCGLHMALPTLLFQNHVPWQPTSAVCAPLGSGGWGGSGEPHQVGHRAALTPEPGWRGQRTHRNLLCRWGAARSGGPATVSTEAGARSPGAHHPHISSCSQVSILHTSV